MSKWISVEKKLPKWMKSPTGNPYPNHQPKRDDKMNCNCINTIDDKLRERNLRLSGYAFMVPSFTTVITVQTEWVDKAKAPRGQRNNPTKMFASHCPFCGVKIELPKEEKENE
jgi:hypothetical protein